MATNWPSSVQTFSTVSAGDSLSSPSHSGLHNDVSDTVEALQEYAGLVLVKTQTIGSGVSSVTVSNAFSATFDAYRIVITNVDASTTSAVYQFTLSGGATGYYYFLQDISYATGAVSIANATAASFALIGNTATASCGHVILDVQSPNLPAYTTWNGLHNDLGTAGIAAGGRASTNQETGFTITPSSGTISGGTIRVYGYNNG